ncbi:hypothetical protein GCM10008107_26700 [Psychrosphaera saromensis]|uniref:Outer membrane protein OmpA-like transmembrane domain-containing protein n=1 Tax=Psychrosphaera saromensis TaxID=716813 RepID=A0A2S7UVG8_9GAMM|nr:outer membrane beta-barrel protein [Psychrosphaera saromensis]PQJ53986.1 hypothetical protein BTO11_10175 [Psychrosphaera saromensis]GHB75924.1 hypothetical protein GCM10008107_26700 [Psychrosphaera saromensis]GLQ14527.1 hypothetical protein GCM10007917_19820 [Psychrosphaera saromensis]
MKLLLTMTTLFVSCLSLAEGAERNHWYAGLGVGHTLYTDDTAERSSVSKDIFAGFKPNRYISIELQYTNWGKYDNDNSVLDHVEIESVGVTTYGILPIDNTGVELTLGLGIHNTIYSEKFNVEGKTINTTSNAPLSLFGTVGINYTYVNTPNITYSFKLKTHQLSFHYELNDGPLYENDGVTGLDSFGRTINSINFSAQYNF